MLSIIIPARNEAENLKDILDYLNLSESSFFRYCNSARSPHLWKKVKGKWKLRHTVNFDGVDLQMCHT